MTSTRKNRIANKRFSKVNEESPDKDAGNSSKSRLRKRKLLDMSGSQWSKEELQRFYEAYRKYGKDWKKVASVLRNRSAEMAESLYNLSRAYLSLPESLSSVAGLIAMMTDHYNMLEGTQGSESERESREGVSHVESNPLMMEDWAAPAPRTATGEGRGAAMDAMGVPAAVVGPSQQAIVGKGWGSGAPATGVAPGSGRPVVAASGLAAMATCGSIHPVAAGKGKGDPLRALLDGSKVSTIFSLLSADGDITRIVSVYHIPPTVLCRRAKTDEPACDDSSGDLVIYEEMLEAGLKFPMPSSLCHVLHYFSLTPGRLAPNGWRILLGFLALWRRVHHEDAAPVVFHASYNLSESPAPNRGWYYFTPKGGKLLTGLRSNCHSWKSRFLFISEEWASERDRALVPVRWSDAKKLDSPVLSTGQEEKLQRVRAYPEKDLGVLLPKDNSVAGGPSSGSPLKRKRRNRQMIGARLSSRSKVAREDGNFSGTAPSASHDVTPSIVTPPIATYVTPPTVTPPVVTHACSHQASSSAATPESPTLASPFAHRLPSPRSGAPSWAGPMLGNPQVIREKLGRFVFPPEVTQINNLGTAGVMNTFLEGLAQVSTASICLLSRAHQLRQDNENMLKELSAAQEKIASLEAAGKVLDADLVAARKRATGFENELSAARERATEAEAELVKVRERASLSEAELTQTRERAALRETALETELKEAHDRASQAGLELEEGIADAFIDGYEELRKKISSAFPAIDFSGFVPTEAPEDSSGYSDEDDDDEAGDESEDEDEDGEDSESD